MFRIFYPLLQQRSRLFLRNTGKVRMLQPLGHVMQEGRDDREAGRLMVEQGSGR